jgi:hypothetical protein
MGVSTMVIPLSRVKDLPWRISTRQGFQKSMVRWLLFLVFLMVRPSFSLPVSGMGCLLSVFYQQKHSQLVVPCFFY